MPVFLENQEVFDLGMGLLVFLTTLLLGGFLANSVYGSEQYVCVDLQPTTAMRTKSFIWAGDESDSDESSMDDDNDEVVPPNSATATTVKQANTVVYSCYE